MRRSRMICLAVAGALILGGCTPTPAPASTPLATPVATPAPTEEPTGFVLPWYPAGSFHPILGSNRLNLTLAPLVYQGLFSVDGQFQPVKELCREYSVSEDGLIWTFKLTDAVFSDGSPLTAREAAASVNVARRCDRFRERLSHITRAVAQGEDTLLITLDKPNGALPVLLDVPIVKDSDIPERPLGTGHYILCEGENGTCLQGAKGAGVSPETIALRGVAASDDLIYAFDAGEISLVDTDLTSTNALGYSGRLEVTDYATASMVYVGFNTLSGPCTEEAVRQAVARCADREGMVKRLLSGHGVASTLPIHPEAADHDKKTAQALQYAPSAAAQLLEEALWRAEDGVLRRGRKTLELKIIVNQDNTAKVKMAQSLAQELEGLGAVVNVEKLPWDEFSAALKKRDFDLYVGETLLTADFDPETLLFGELNYGGFRDEETEELLEAYRRAEGMQRRQAARALLEKLVQAVPVAPLCFKNGSLLTRWGQVSGATPTQRNVFAGLENWLVDGS